jgi:hypothetical protein
VKVQFGHRFSVVNQPMRLENRFLPAKVGAMMTARAKNTLRCIELNVRTSE